MQSISIASLFFPIFIDPYILPSVHADTNVILIFETWYVLKLHRHIDACHVEFVVKLLIVRHSIGINIVGVTAECNGNAPNETLVILKRRYDIRFYRYLQTI